MTRRGWLLFVAMSIIWGTPYLLIRIAVREVSPGTLIFLRTAPAALLLLPLAVRRGTLRPLLAHWRWIVVYTVVELGIPWLFIGRAEVHLTSSVTGLLVASVPLTGAVIYRIFGEDRLDRRRVLGLLVGFGGVVALVGTDYRGTDVGAVLEIIIPTLGYSIGPLIIARRLADLPGLGVITASFVIAGLAYAPFGLTHLPHHLPLECVLALIGLAFGCTALAFVLFFQLIAEVGPARSTVITYVNPAVAITLGVAVLGEPFTVGLAVGFPLILLGSWLATAKGGSGIDGHRLTEAAPEAGTATGVPELTVDPHSS